MGYKLFLSLNVSKGKATDLWAFAVGRYRMPFNTLEFQKEVHNVDRVNEVDESIADIALSLKVLRMWQLNIYLKIHRKVEIVVLPDVTLVDHVQKSALLELVRNIPDHDGCTFFSLIKNPI